MQNPEFVTKLYDYGLGRGAVGVNREPLDNWYKIASKAAWSKLVEVQSVFPTAEAVGNFTIFNIKGNKYRLIVSIDYAMQLAVQIRMR